MCETNTQPMSPPPPLQFSPARHASVECRTCLLKSLTHHIWCQLMTSNFVVVVFFFSRGSPGSKLSHPAATWGSSLEAKKWRWLSSSCSRRRPTVVSASSERSAWCSSAMWVLLSLRPFWNALPLTAALPLSRGISSASCSSCANSWRAHCTHDEAHRWEALREALCYCETPLCTDSSGHLIVCLSKSNRIKLINFTPDGKILEAVRRPAAFNSNSEKWLPQPAAAPILHKDCELANICFSSRLAKHSKSQTIWSQ